MPAMTQNAPPLGYNFGPGADPFAPDPSDRRVPLQTVGYDFTFTRRWFIHRNLTTWSTFLLPRFGGGRRMRMIQIGVFEGMDLAWCCQNLLTHPASHALAIDPWDPTTKLSSDYMQAVEQRAARNLRPWADKLTIIKGYSQEYLQRAEVRGGYDLAVIDGDHNATPVFRDALLCLAQVKPGGWLVFDDVRNRRPKKDHVAEGIQRFLEIAGDRVAPAWRHRYCDCYQVL